MTSYRGARRYDHRIRNMIVNSGNPNLFPSLRIPKSITRDWLRKGKADVVTLPELDLAYDDLLTELQNLKMQLTEAKTQSSLIMKTVKILGFEMQYRRLPKGAMNEQILESIRSATQVVPLLTCLS